MRALQQPTLRTLLCSDDVMIPRLSERACRIACRLGGDQLAEFGLRLNVEKMEHLTNDVDGRDSITVDNVKLPRTDVLKYLGFTISSD